MSSPDTRPTAPQSTPLTPASFLGDENALKRAFDLEFNAAIAEARSKLGDATSLAPRVLRARVWRESETGLAVLQRPGSDVRTRRVEARRLERARHRGADDPPLPARRGALNRALGGDAG